MQITVGKTSGPSRPGQGDCDHIGTLNLARVSDEFSFNTLLREPLQELYRGGYGEPSCWSSTR